MSQNKYQKDFGLKNYKITNPSNIKNNMMIHLCIMQARKYEDRICLRIQFQSQTFKFVSLNFVDKKGSYLTNCNLAKGLSSVFDVFQYDHPVCVSNSFQKFQYSNKRLSDVPFLFVNT